MFSIIIVTNIVFFERQAMSDHFDHYQRPPSRDSSVDRYSRAASRLSGGSRQSSVEKSQQQQQQQPTTTRRPGDGDPIMSSSSATSKQNSFSPFVAAQQQPPPFEEIILRQRNLGQEIVPSPVGQPKRTESLYVNPNAARKDTAKPKVSTVCSDGSSSGVGVGGGSGGGAFRKPRLLPPPPVPVRQ